MKSIQSCLRSRGLIPASSRVRTHRNITRRPLGATDGKYSNAADVHRELSERAATEGTGTLPLVIYFTASWCGPCKLVTKEIYKVHLTHQFKLLTVDIDEEKEFASSLKVRTVPTIMFVGTAPTSSPALSTHGNVSSMLLADILDNKLQYAGADIAKSRRLT